MQRVLLQATAAAQPSCECPACPSGDLAGISAGGWVAIATLAGVIVGVLGTLLLQCCLRYNRERSQAYATVGAGEAGRHASPAGSASPAPGHPHRQRGLQEQPSFSPLTARASVGGTREPSKLAGGGKANVLVVHEASGDVGADDQMLPPHAVVQMGGRPLNNVASFKSIEEHESLRLSTDSSVAPVVGARCTGSGGEGAGAKHLLGAMEQNVMNPMYEAQQGPGGYRTAAVGTAAYPLVTGARTPSPLVAAGQPLQQAAQPSGLRASTSSGVRAASPHNTETVESEYEVEELDDAWRKLLADLDEMLARRCKAPMDARERAVAIKKLLVATGTRGRDFAMHAALEEVLRFRKYNPA